jgi:P27 family predicted phage terminase small subunit
VAGRGPAPKAVHVQRRNAPKALASVTALVPDVACPAPPAGLLKATKGQWVAFWSSPVAKLVDTDSDLPALGRLFELVDECARYRTSIRQTPFIEGSMGQQVRNPLVKDLQSAQAELRQLEDRFGLSPRARLSLGVVLGEAKRSLADLGAAFNSDGGSGDDGDDPREGDDDPRVKGG